MAANLQEVAVNLAGNFWAILARVYGSNSSSILDTRAKRCLARVIVPDHHRPRVGGTDRRSATRP
jgi:hypothetical protein